MLMHHESLQEEVNEASNSLNYESIRRKLFVRNLREALSQVIVVEEYSTPLAKKAVALTCYGIASGNGLPLGQPREARAIWVLNWMAMAGAFQHNLLPCMDKETVRLHITLGLLMSPANEVTEWINSYVPGG
ncbi:uncharacterized protein DS421_15g494860 [Arachis hypogaea]|nr:uncharacterized protein DS421_15g494860 [Arachis hypogaea]